MSLEEVVPVALVNLARDHAAALEKRLLEVQGHGWFRPNFSMSSFALPRTLRDPRLTCVSYAKPFLRLLVTSKALGIEVQFVLFAHGTPPDWPATEVAAAVRVRLPVMATVNDSAGIYTHSHPIQRPIPGDIAGAPQGAGDF